MKKIVDNKSFPVEIVQFLWQRKAYWIVPAVVLLILLILLILIGTSPASPFIYTLI